MSDLLNEVVGPLLGDGEDQNLVSAIASMSQARAQSSSDPIATISAASRASSASPEVPSSSTVAVTSGQSRSPPSTGSSLPTSEPIELLSTSQRDASLTQKILESLSTNFSTSSSSVASARATVSSAMAFSASSILGVSAATVSLRSTSSLTSTSISGVITSAPVLVESLEDQGTIFNPTNRMFPLGVVIIVAAGLLVLVSSIVMTLRLLRCTEHRRRRRELEADAPDFFDPGTSTADLIRSQTYEKSPSVQPNQSMGRFDPVDPGIGPASSSWAPRAVAASNSYLLPSAAGQRELRPRSPDSFYAPPSAYPLQDGPYPVHTGATRDLFQRADAYHHSRQGSGDSEKDRLRRNRPHDFV